MLNFGVEFLHYTLEPPSTQWQSKMKVYFGGIPDSLLKHVS